MKSFRTELQVTPSAHPIRHGTSLFTIGSCFANAIGQRLEANKFITAINPFGTLFDPFSIHRALLYARNNEPASVSKYLQSQDVWYHYHFHSSFRATEKKILENKINEAIGAAHYFLKDAAVVMITYGSAKVFKSTDDGEWVANCHKVPTDKFTPEIQSPEKIIESFEQFYAGFNKWNPGARIILSVSPVRHVKDSLVLNSASKASLRWACLEIAKKYSAVEYFPAFEMLMDDLRDYRFYKDDLIHPSEAAIEYIWEKFSEVYFDSSTRMLIRKWQEVVSSMNHRPFQADSAMHKKFLKATLAKLEELDSSIPVADEINDLRKQLSDS